MLIILGGLPGTGKTTIARALAQRIIAVHLRIDTIEEAVISSGIANEDLGPCGYMVAYALAKDNLRLGHTVIADSVNPIEITRGAWRATAKEAQSPFLEVEIVCSDSMVHQQRVESREYPVRTVTWQQVLDREYEAWRSASLRIDTATASVEAIVATIEEALVACSPY